MQVVDALKHGKQKLASSDSARLDAELLLCAILKCKRTRLYSHPEQEIETEQLNRFNDLISQRAQGQPIAHLTKQKEFWSLQLTVSPDTLIPRPETEMLVEKALTLVPDNANCEILELGTGTGAIAIAIASERSKANITATDFSENALEIAKKNAASNNINNIKFIKADWFDFTNVGSYDVIISNPPYICEDDPHLQQGDVQFEPITALAAGKDGLDDIRCIIQHSQPYLKPEGWLLLEHGYNQATQVRQLLNHAAYNSISTIKDYSGIERLSMAQRKN